MFKRASLILSTLMCAAALTAPVVFSPAARADAATKQETKKEKKGGKSAEKKEKKGKKRDKQEIKSVEAVQVESAAVADSLKAVLGALEGGLRKNKKKKGDGSAKQRTQNVMI